MTAPNTESAVLAQCREYLERIGCVVTRAHSGMVRKGKAFIRLAGEGTSDLIACVPPDGRFVGIETKRPKGGVISQAQLDFRASVERAGGTVIFATCVEDVQRVIEGRGR